MNWADLLPVGLGFITGVAFLFPFFRWLVKLSLKTWRQRGELKRTANHAS